MRTSIIAAAAVALLGTQAPGLTRIGALAPAAHADQVWRYEGGANIQHMSAPQRTQALAQAEGTRGTVSYGRQYSQAEGTQGQTTYGRQYSQAEGTQGQTTYGRQYSQAEGTQGQTSYGRRYSQAEGTQGQNQNYTAAEQTGVDNGRAA